MMATAMIMLGILFVAGSVAQLQPQFSWLFNCTPQIPYAHNVILEPIRGTSMIAAAFQAGLTEGGSMHLRFALSQDGGVTWGPSTIAVPSVSGRSGWGPVLHHNGSNGELHLFYSLSRSVTANFSNPGGDCFRITSRTMGRDWGAPTLIFSQDDFDGNPKYFVNQLAVRADGTLVLPFGTTAPGYPRTPGKAGVLLSGDGGARWSHRGNLTLPVAPYISAILEPAISPDARLMVMRSGNGWLYASASVGGSAGSEWGTPARTAVPNPNSRPSLCGGGDAGGGDTDVLYLAVNPDNIGVSDWPAWGRRSELAILRGVRNSSSAAGWDWRDVYAVLEPDNGVNNCYPSIVTTATHLVTAYSVYTSNIPRIGIKAAMLMPDQQKFVDCVMEQTMEQAKKAGADTEASAAWAKRMVKEAIQMNDIPEIPFVPHGVREAVAVVKNKGFAGELDEAQFEEVNAAYLMQMITMATPR